MMASGDFVLTPVDARRGSRQARNRKWATELCPHCSCSSATGRDTGGRISARLNHRWTYMLCCIIQLQLPEMKKKKNDSDHATLSEFHLSG
jgi:hypothetical protein